MPRGKKELAEQTIPYATSVKVEVGRGKAVANGGQEACVPAVLRRRPGNQAKKATSTEKRSSFVKLVRWLSMPMTVGAWTSCPISWSAGSDSGCSSESIIIAVRA